MAELTREDRRAAHRLLFQVLAKLEIHIDIRGGAPTLRGKTDLLTVELIDECKRLKEAIIECVEWNKAEWSGLNAFTGERLHGLVDVDRFASAYSHFLQIMRTPASLKTE